MFYLITLVTPVFLCASGDAKIADAVSAVTTAKNYAFTLDGVSARHQDGQPLHVVADKIEFFRKDNILVYKDKGEWQRTRTGTLSDPLRILGPSAKVRALRLPSEELKLLSKAVANAKAGAALDLDADLARKLARTEDADLAKSATAKFWLDADGKLAKYEIAIRVQGRRGNADVDGVVTRTVTLSGMGSTKVDVPAPALKALEAR
jgi:hypothetical protein